MMDVPYAVYQGWGNNEIIGKADNRSYNNTNGSIVCFTNNFITKYTILLING
jgi:hypothetical protein